jgi:hypothetical protein
LTDLNDFCYTGETSWNIGQGWLRSVDQRSQWLKLYGDVVRHTCDNSTGS